MNRLLEMETFVQVVDAGGISAAADRMDTAKSAVSRRLAELESRVGASLLNRTTRRLSLTGAGAAFYERCKTILADVAEAEQCVGDAEADLRGTLRVAAPVSFGVAHLGPAINDFLMEHPDVAFDLDFNDRQIDLVAEGFDLAIRIAKLRDSSLMARRLTSIRSVVCASPGYWNARGRPQRPAELKQHLALRYSNAPRRGWSWAGPGGDRGSVSVPGSQIANNGTYLGQAAIAGLGVICIPLFIVYEAIESGELEPALTEYRWGDVDAYAVYPQTRHVSRRVRAFIDFLAERFGDTPYWDLCLEGGGP
ncbi:MAG: LysR family transcriptional regulator [Gammaproteobacteria bacterium]|nr:LysR family transcriptional regulator [Gammaproteobacteria bacterium]MBT8443839.1 LysR family transcriptional regulator [Gammaproteobacteria bacterium]NND35522.1 LysR family transcriptional regulator [Gammaproteobacteria bacterium]